MYRKSITAVLCLILLLGLIFQYNRNDGFLRLLRNTNAVVINAAVKEKSVPEGVVKERYLLLYDSLSADSIQLSENLKKTLEDLKKSVVMANIDQEILSNLPYTGVIVAAANLDGITSLDAIRQYVGEGGKVYFTVAPTIGPAFGRIAEEVGFRSFGEPIQTKGFKILSNILIGGQGFILCDEIYSSNSVHGELAGNARVHMISLEDVPLLWDTTYGKGTYIFYNGTNLQEKNSRGIIASLLSLGNQTFIYPVVGIKTVCIDDFPAPFPEGSDERIYREYHLSNPDFFRQIWWPDMLALAQKYDIKYTGLAVETYNDNVKGPYNPYDNDKTNRNNLIIYGRELLKNGGELGLHGYNHEPLVIKSELYTPEYKPWETEQNMQQASEELHRYIKEVYPDYKLKVYVPPSNILGSKGRLAVTQAFPDLKVIASIYNGQERDSYIQDYGSGEDGIFDMPRLSWGYQRSADMDLNILNGINYLGVFAHFLHPDNIFYEENKNKTWRDMYSGLEEVLQMVQQKFGWLRSCTVSQGSEYFKDYLHTDYCVQNNQDGVVIYSWGFREEAYFIMRTTRRIKSVQGCQTQLIDKGAYLIKVNDPVVVINFESEA